jgi:hypothetical protein
MRVLKVSNKDLLRMAIEKGNSLFIDAANCADPYSLDVEEEQLDNVYVLNAEAIYRFRDTIKQASYWMHQFGLEHIFVSTIGGLFSYDDPKENQNVITHCVELLEDLSKTYPVYVAYDKKYEVKT